MRAAESFQPVAGGRKFGLEADVEDIASHGDMAGALRLEIGDKPVQHVHVVDEMAPAGPIDIAGQPFAQQFAFSRSRQRADMSIGQMGKQQAQQNSGRIG